MLYVSLIGTGTVSQHLQEVFAKTTKVQIVQVLSSRSSSLLKDLKKKHCDICIIAVSDDSINAVSQKLKEYKKVIAHTSGSVPISALQADVRRGVFYPLQTFSKERKVDFSEIPICIEAEEETDLLKLKALAETISTAVYEISSEQRKSLHLAAVFANNFTNHLYQISQNICAENKVPFDILKPLIKETAAKIEDHTPFEAQTGPAIRNDEQTIQRHLAQLQNKTHRKTYQILTESIRKTHGEKL